MSESNKRQKDILSVLQEPPILPDYAAVKVHFRRVIRDIKVFDGKLVEIELNM
jgi:hypothetical protein